VVEDVENKAKQAEKRKQKVAANTEKVRKQLEAEITAQIKDEITEQIRTEIQTQLELDYQQKLEQIRVKFETNQPKIDHKTEQEPVQEVKIKPSKNVKIDMETKQIVEAILFAAEKPMTAKQIQKIFPELERPDLTIIEDAIDSIIEDYAARSIGLKRLSSGYRFQVKEGYSYWVSRIFEDKPPKYSRALLETVAIIAYRQPVTRGDIEDIRGVSVSSNMIRTLLDREWIRVIAHKEVPGRPALYGSTKQFLDYFNLSSLGQLPTLEEIKEFDFTPEQITLKKNELNLDKENKMDPVITTEGNVEIEQVESETIMEGSIPTKITKEKTIEEQAIEEAEREEQEIIELVLENRE
jgi:segregation and condensation protein B